MTDPFNRNPFADPNGLTLADMIVAAETDDELEAQRRRNVASAIRSFCKAVGKMPLQIPAHTSFVRPHLKRLHPAQTGLKKSRIANIKSDLLFALKRYGSRGGAAYMASFTPAWQRLWDTEMGPTAVYDKRSVSRLMRLCSARGIDPDDVDDDVAGMLLEALIDESLVPDPRARWKKILYAWNKLVERVPEWPRRKLTIPDDSRIFTIPLEKFPQPLQDEIAAAMNRWAGTDILDDTGPDKPLAPATLKKRLVQLRELASALVLSGRSMEDIMSLAKIVEVSAAKTILQFYLERAGGKTTSRIHGLAVMIKTLAKHDVGVDDDHLEALKDLCNRVDPKPVGMTDKNRDRLRPFDDPKNALMLLRLPHRTVEQILREDRGLERDALAVQLALAIEILIMAPVRLKNLAGLNIDRHIQRTRTADGAVHIVIPGDEVKNGEPLDHPLPEETVKILDLYLDHFRLRSCSATNPWLFPGQSEDVPKASHTLSVQLKQFVFDGTGLEVNVHLFRHLTAKLFLDQHPGQYEIVRRHLGHRSINTTIKAYSGMETAAASRHFDDTILKLRGTSVMVGA